MVVTFQQAPPYKQCTTTNTHPLESLPNDSVDELPLLLLWLLALRLYERDCDRLAERPRPRGGSGGDDR